MEERRGPQRSLCKQTVHPSSRQTQRGSCGSSFSPVIFCPEAASPNLIMQLKSFSWAEQIFTAYFAADCFAWRKVLPFRLACLAHIHTFAYPITRGPNCEQVEDKRAPRNQRQCRDMAGVSQANVFLFPPRCRCGLMTSVVPLRQP